VNDPGPIPDPDAERYQEHWQPVLDAAARRLFARVVALAPTARRVLDLGAGTGALTRLARHHWPQASVIALDASAAMLAVAQRRQAALARAAAGPIEWLVRDAASTGIEARSVDAVLSSFVLQLVPDRVAVLREMERVLQPDGVFGFVTWIAEELHLPPDDEFDEAVYELELDDPDSVFREPKLGDYESIEQARHELAEAGFADIDVRDDRLSYTWSPDGYLHFKASFDERELLDSLSAADRERLLARVRQRWEALPASAFTLRAPLVSAVARLGRGSPRHSAGG